MHTTQPAAARLPYQRAASGPAVPRTLSRFASNAAAHSKSAFAPSRARYDVVAVQKSVSMLQQISSTPLHATQASSGPSQAVQPVSGYTMAAQPNMLGAYLATRICLAVHPLCRYTMAAQPNMLGTYLATRICLAVQPPCGYTMAAQPNMLGACLATRICLTMMFVKRRSSAYEPCSTCKGFKLYKSRWLMWVF